MSSHGESGAAATDDVAGARHIAPASTGSRIDRKKLIDAGLSSYVPTTRECANVRSCSQHQTQKLSSNSIRLPADAKGKR
jgi:hypothetical protein